MPGRGRVISGQSYNRDSLASRLHLGEFGGSGFMSMFALGATAHYVTDKVIDTDTGTVTAKYFETTGWIDPNQYVAVQLPKANVTQTHVMVQPGDADRIAVGTKLVCEQHQKGVLWKETYWKVKTPLEIVP